MQTEGATLGIGDYVAMLRRYWWLAAAIVLVFVATAVVFTRRQADVFQGQSVVLLRTGVNSQLFPPVGNNFNAFIRQPSAELEFVQSDAFRSELPPGPSVSVSAPEGGNQLIFTASAATPAAAVAAANVWADTYIRVRFERDVEDNELARADAEEIQTGLEAEREAILAPLKPLDDALSRETESENITLLTTQRLALQQTLADELLPVENEIRNINAELAQLNSVARFLDRSDVSAVVSRRAVNGRQTAPQPVRDVGLAAVLGLFTALAAVLLFENVRNRISGVEDIRRLSDGVPLLAEIPKNSQKNNAISPAVREGVERLLTAIGFAGRTSGLKVVLLTSVQEGEGKTSTSVWLAGRAAAQGLKVLLIDADLRRSMVHTFTNLDREPGLTNMEAESDRPIEDFVRTVQTPDGAAFDVITAGAHTDMPGGLLRGPLVSLVVSKLSPYYQLVIIDTPPVLPVSDAEVLSELVADGVVLLSRAGSTRRDEFRRALDRIRPLDVELIGTVLVGTKTRSSYYYR